MKDESSPIVMLCGRTHGRMSDDKRGGGSCGQSSRLEISSRV